MVAVSKKFQYWSKALHIPSDVGHVCSQVRFYHPNSQNGSFICLKMQDHIVTTFETVQITISVNHQ